MKNNSLAASMGALSGLLYIVFLPVVGIVAALWFLVYRIIKMLRPPETTPPDMRGRVDHSVKSSGTRQPESKYKNSSAPEGSDHVKPSMERR